MKLLVWGIGQLCWQTLKNVNESDVIGFVDTYAKKEVFANKRVYKPEEIKSIEYDAVLVSTIFAREIKEYCDLHSVDQSKFIYVYGNIIVDDLNKDYEFVKKICGKKFANSIKKRYHLIREIDMDLSEEIEGFIIDDLVETKYYRNDFVRLKTLELIVREIERNQIKGNVAELGVFQGDFAQFINAAFENRKLYLFDTFEGFDDNELKREVNKDIRSAVRDIFKNTSIDIVMNKMKYPDQVEIKRGYFPESLNGLEDRFSFVSIDCDWEESIYQGISYFYPRLERGGYIMIHDYNNSWVCAKKAISRYERENDGLIPKVPICDTQGSIVLTK